MSSLVSGSAFSPAGPFGPTWGFMTGWVSLVAGFSAPIAASALALGLEWRRAEHADINDQNLSAQRAKALFHKQNLIALGVEGADQRNPAARVPIHELTHMLSQGKQ